MSREFPDWVNPRKAAEGKRIFSGTVPLDRMERLRTLLAGGEGEAGFMAAFSLDRQLDPQGRVIVRLEVEAELPLTCQATLERFRYPVMRKSLLVVVEDESEQAVLPENYEPTCSESGGLRFDRLVEDELLLAMPQVPRKPGLEGVSFSTDPDTPADEPAGREGHHRPFAALEQLLQGDRKGGETE